MSKQSSGHAPPEAPRYDDLPTPRRRAARGGANLIDIEVRLEVITPIFGGSYATRSIDDVDVIRAPSIRGQLRFWWRALYAEQCSSTEELYKRESELWGGAGTDDVRRSAVEIRICTTQGEEGEVDDSDILPYRKTGAYAVWPARGTDGEPTAPRRKPGTKFSLTLKVPDAGNDAIEVRNALRAWILFGGYGGRTRRGLGSLTVIGDASEWLPLAPGRESFAKLFGFDIFASNPTGVALGDVPRLGGSALYFEAKVQEAEGAWKGALKWLEEFRQGISGRENERAREPGVGKEQPNRPSISNWPEADKIRHLMRKTKGHPPRHNEKPAWPRAGFGLPIVGRFQSKRRDDGPYDEPDSFELRWRRAKDEYERLASPLIVKALPLADGTFTACALWLNRAYPANGKVFLRDKPNSEAPFDLLVAPGDTPRFSALANHKTLRDAFLSWLQAKSGITVVAP